MERIVRSAVSIEEIAAIEDYDKSNILTGRRVIVYHNDALEYFLELSEQEQIEKIIESLPQDVLKNYNHDSLRYSMLLRNHDSKNQFLVLTGIPKPKNLVPEDFEN